MNTGSNAVSFVKIAMKGPSPDVVEMVKKTALRFIESDADISLELKLRALASIAVTGKIFPEFVGGKKNAKTLKDKAVEAKITLNKGPPERSTMSGLTIFLESDELNSKFGGLGKQLYSEAGKLVPSRSL